MKKEQLEDFKELLITYANGEESEEHAARQLYDVEKAGTIEETGIFKDDNDLRQDIKEYARECDGAEDSFLNGYSWGEVTEMLWDDTMSHNDYEALKETYMEENNLEELNMRWGTYYNPDDVETIFQDNDDMEAMMVHVCEEGLGYDLSQEQPQHDDETLVEIVLRVIDQHQIKQELSDAVAPSILYKDEQAQVAQASNNGDTHTQTRKRAM